MYIVLDLMTSQRTFCPQREAAPWYVESRELKGSVKTLGIILNPDFIPESIYFKTSVYSGHRTEDTVKCNHPALTDFD